MSIYYVHACMIPICLGTSYQVHSYLFSFFMRESFSSCLLIIITRLSRKIIRNVKNVVGTALQKLRKQGIGLKVHNVNS